MTVPLVVVVVEVVTVRRRRSGSERVSSVKHIHKISLLQRCVEKESESETLREKANLRKEIRNYFKRQIDIFLSWSMIFRWKNFRGASRDLVADS